ncbi:MAG: DNA polymerase III subunit alpha, partial [Tenericutes bacterium HGW-Tenericutes-8]
MAGFLYFQSEYSLLKSMIKLQDMAAMSLQAGYDTIFLSDENNLYAAYKFFKHTKTAMKRIIGMKIDLMHMGRQTSLLVYAQNASGFQNLIIISSLINLSKDQLIDFKDLIKYQEHLIMVTPGFESDIDGALLKSEYDLALQITLDYKKSITNFYIGLSLQTLKLEMVIAPLLKRLATAHSIKLLPVHKTNYLKHQKEAYDALIKIENPANERYDDGDFSFKTYQELQSLFSEYPEVFTNLDDAFRYVDFNFDHKTFELPKVRDDSSVQSHVYLKDLCMLGLKKRYRQAKWAQPETYKERLDFELKTIHKMGYDDYFLVVWDFVKYAKQKGIMVGPGRGSAAGSLVSYCLGITDVDPIQYDLLFERFLNPERISMPDIDLDFPDNRRDEVIQYVAEKYGKKRVLSITTFSTLQVKSSIRDICRTQNLSMNDTNRIVKLATSAGVILDPNTQHILDLAKQIEGLPRQTGTHAAGIILSHEDLSRIIPFQTGASNLYQSQFEASDLESLGLLKIDFLGIRNLSIITDVLTLLKTTKQLDIDILNIPFNDQKTYDLLSKADTQGVFQLESVGMRRVLMKLKPNT